MELQIDASATTQQVQKAYRVACLKAHPDKGGTPAKMELVTKAPDAVLDPIKRTQHLHATRPYPAGQYVRLHGLNIATNLNGLQGVAGAWDGLRLQVHLPSGIKSVRPENVSSLEAWPGTPLGLCRLRVRKCLRFCPGLEWECAGVGLREQGPTGTPPPQRAPILDRVEASCLVAAARESSVLIGLGCSLPKGGAKGAPELDRPQQRRPHSPQRQRLDPRHHPHAPRHRPHAQRQHPRRRDRALVAGLRSQSPLMHGHLKKLKKRR